MEDGNTVITRINFVCNKIPNLLHSRSKTTFPP